MIKYLIAFLLIASPCLAGMGIGGFPQPGPGIAPQASGGSITYESISSGAVTSTSDITLTIAKPSGVSSGDTLVAVISKQYNRSFLLSGWTTVGVSNKHFIQYLIKTAEASEPDSYVFNSTEASNTCAHGVIIRLSGSPSSTNYIAPIENSTYNTTVTYPNPTVSVNNSIVIWAGTRATISDNKTLTSITRGNIVYNNTNANAAAYSFFVAVESGVAVGSPITAATGTLSSAGNLKYGGALWFTP